MTPIRQLISRIRWDPEFARAEFVLGYADHVAERIVTAPLAQVRFPDDFHFGFEFTDAQGVVRSIPWHRVRQLYRDGVLIWERPGPADRHDG